MSLRNANHPIYFSLGGLVMTAATWAALEAYDRHGLGFGRSVTFIASTSLFTFSFGNLVLVFAPSLDLGALGSMVYAVVLLGLVVLLSFVFKRILTVGEADRKGGRASVWAALSRSQTALVGWISRLTTRPAAAYAGLLRPPHR